MHKKIKIIINNIEKIFNNKIIDKLSKKHLFVKRKGKLDAKSFLNLCTFLGKDLCSAPLSKLCGKLEANENILISPQALNNRFNEASVNFMKDVFLETMKAQNKILQTNDKLLKTHFNRITIVDSTGFKLDDMHAKEYKGCGVKSSIKIQLQYDLLTGKFIICDVGQGSVSDASYIPDLQNSMIENDLCLKDLGYFKIDDLKFIEEHNAFYVSKSKINTNFYKKEEIIEYGFRGKIKIRERYSLININEIIKPLAEDETIELNDIYIGSTKKNRTKIRLILTKLNQDCKRKKENNNEKAKIKGKIKALEKNKWWLEFNCYITNVSVDVLKKEQVHEIYSLRWQVELMFKIWKSLFKIHKVKKTKLERFHCFLYGRLIILLLTSSIVFTARKTIYVEKNKEISLIKSFGIIEEYLCILKENIFKCKFAISNLLKRIINSIEKLGIKSRKKAKKTSLLILKNLEIRETELTKIAI